jgi:uncharacterized protein (DUF427 family)
MGLTIGSAPFGQRPAGVFNADLAAPEHLLYFEDSPRRVRVLFAGRTVVDSNRVKLLHETARVPCYYFPLDDVAADALEPSTTVTHCPAKGDATYWSLVVGGRTARDAVWAYEKPLESAHWLAGYCSLQWDAVDGWYEEDEQIFGHPKDPYHRIDIVASSRHVRVSHGGVLLAESRRPMLLFETGLPVRYYLPAEDVRTDLLVHSDSHSRCPYKGVASYYSVRTAGAGELLRDLAWYYPDPTPEAGKISGLVCFYNERVELEVDDAGVAGRAPRQSVMDDRKNSSA